MTIITSAIPGTVLALAAFSKKALTTSEIIPAWFLCLLITVSGGIPAFVILAMLIAGCGAVYLLRRRVK